jgi:hypothetical protein
MENKNTGIEELSEKILRGLKIALRKLVERKAALNESLVIGDKDGTIKSVPAKELLETLE